MVVLVVRKGSYGSMEENLQDIKQNYKEEGAEIEFCDKQLLQIKANNTSIAYKIEHTAGEDYVIVQELKIE